MARVVGDRHRVPSRGAPSALAEQAASIGRIVDTLRAHTGNGCFACGLANPVGLHVDGFVLRVVATSQPGSRPRPDLQGTVGALHGGIAATALDEILVWAGIIQEEVLSVTAKLGACATRDRYEGWKGGSRLRARVEERRGRAAHDKRGTRRRDREGVGFGIRPVPGHPHGGRTDGGPTGLSDRRPATSLYAGPAVPSRRTLVVVGHRLPSPVLLHPSDDAGDDAHTPPPPAATPPGMRPARGRTGQVGPYRTPARPASHSP